MYDDGSKEKNRNNSDIAISKQSFQVDGEHIYLYLNFKEMYFEFVNVDGKTVFRGGKATNRMVLMRQGKAELKKRGCSFGKETRDKSNKDERS